MGTEYRAQEYIDGVLDGSIVTCKWVKLAVKRHARDLKHQRTKRFPYYFDESAASRPVDFITRFCFHVKGDFANRRERLSLEPWQQFIVWTLFGWRKVSDGKRKYTLAFIEVAKKNGKSTFAAGIGLYMMVADGEQGAEVYSAATTKDQAKIVFFEYARAMVLKSEELQKVIEVYKHSITSERSMSSFHAVSSDVDPLDGKNAHMAIIDEYHAHKTDGVYNIMRYGMGARSQPLLFVITTAGFDPSVPCVAEEEYAMRVLERKVIAEEYFAIVYTLDAKDDWTDESKWIKANPNLGISCPLDRLREDCQKAVQKPDEINKFKNKRLNIWTKSQSIWIRSRDWSAIQEAFEPKEKAPCYAGIDLSKTIDTTAKALCFPVDEVYHLRVAIYLPEHDIAEREKQERVPWRQWAEQGHVFLTPGRTVDYDFIQAQLLADAEKYDLREIAYDPYNSSQFISNLEKEGLGDRLVEFSQGWKLISPASKDFHSKTLNRQLRVQPNPCLDWMVSCTEIATDANGNIRPVKPDVAKTRKHIDGVLAGLMALDRAVRNQKQASVYEKRGVISV